MLFVWLVRFVSFIAVLAVVATTSIMIDFKKYATIKKYEKLVRRALYGATAAGALLIMLVLKRKAAGVAEYLLPIVSLLAVLAALTTDILRTKDVIPQNTTTKNLMVFCAVGSAMALGSMWLSDQYQKEKLDRAEKLSTWPIVRHP